MLVGSRPSPADVRAYGRLEVTFAFDAAPFPDQAVDAPPVGATFSPPAPAHSIPQSSGSAATGRSPRSELDEIRQQIAVLREAVGQKTNVVAGPPAFGDYFSEASAALDQRSVASRPAIMRLCSNGLEVETAREIAAAAVKVPGDMQKTMVDVLTTRIPVTPFSDMKPGECRTLAFFGPAGRGKTTSLVKIAVQCGLAKRVPVRIYSAGAHSVGGQEQMARYAAILGVPFHAFESLESLHLALNGDAWKGLILIDTPGLSRADTSEVSALAGFFSRRPEIEKHLVLRADARTAEVLHVVSSFASLAPSRLLFTGLDEALTLGAMVEVLVRTGIPAAFAGTGQRIPEDIEAAGAAKWARTICAGNPMAVAAAA
jgi:flagellar biosynthesis GTPase FlhF